jgi:hypothetical protein
MILACSNPKGRGIKVSCYYIQSHMYVVAKLE